MDPYATVGIAGHKGKTKVIWNNQDPQWNQQINVAIRVCDQWVEHCDIIRVWSGWGTDVIGV